MNGRQVLPDDPGVDVSLGDDKAVQQDGAQQHEHPRPIGQHNVARDHRCAPEEGHPNLVGHEEDGPVHEEPVDRQHNVALLPG